ncbi:hypothetical protein ACLOJK_018164 [Asimina triloba]
MREGRLLQLPSALTATILAKLDISSLRSAASTCKSLNSISSHILSFLPDFHLLGFHDKKLPPWTPEVKDLTLLWEIFPRSITVDLFWPQDVAPSLDLLRPLLPPNPNLRSLKLDCGRLDDFSISFLVRPSLHELCLHNCENFSGGLLLEVGKKCTDLRKGKSRENLSLENASSLLKMSTTIHEIHTFSFHLLLFHFSILRCSSKVPSKKNKGKGKRSIDFSPLGSLAEKRGYEILISDIEDLLTGCHQLEFQIGVD